MYNQHEVTVSLMDDTAYGTNLEVPYIDDEPSAETRNSSGEFVAEQTEADESDVLDQGCLIQNRDNNDSVPRGPVNLIDEIDEFIPGVRRYYKNICGRELREDEKYEFRQLLPMWNTFLQQNQGIRGTSAIISSDIKNDLRKFIPWLREQRGTQLIQDYKIVFNNWLTAWNVFLQARAGKTLVTCLNLCLTIVGFIFYILDLASDVGTSVYYASNGQWWRVIVTLALVYGAVICHMIIKWIINEIHCAGSADWLRYVGSLLTNWPDVKQYGGLCLLEWKLHKSPTNNAYLIPEWDRRRLNVACLKYTEGVCATCPQAILQLCRLLPDLYDYHRNAASSISLCTADVALVNREKYERIKSLSTRELALLHMWVVPVTVSRLLLTLHPYWALAGVALHLVLNGVYCIARTITYRRVLHAIHFLVNTVATMVWAVGTPLMRAHPALFTAIICFNTAMFTAGLVGWQLHEKYWPYSYFKEQKDWLLP